MTLWTRQPVVERICLSPNQAKPDSVQPSLLLYVCHSAHQARPDFGQASVSGQHERPGEDDLVCQGVPGRESGRVPAVR